MQQQVPLWVTLFIAIITPLGALISQAISFWGNTRTKKIELWYTYKAEAYKAFLKEAINFGYDIASDDYGVATENYTSYLSAYTTVMLFASKKVLRTINGQNGLNRKIQDLRHKKLSGNIDPLILMSIIDTWGENINKVQEAMSKDLRALPNR